MEDQRRTRQLEERGVLRAHHESTSLDGLVRPRRLGDIELAPRSECVQVLSRANYKAKARIAMKLPPDYLDLVNTAAEVLRSHAAHGRHDAARRPDVPELWLAVRDYEGLAERLAAPERLGVAKWLRRPRIQWTGSWRP